MSPHTPSDSTRDPGGGAFLPEAPAIVPSRAAGGAVIVSAEGEVEELGAEAALALIEREPVMLVHAGFTARRIARGRPFGAPGPHVLDLMELFAFAHPAAPCLPTPDGLARALGLDAGATPESQAIMLHKAAAQMLARLQDRSLPDRQS